MLDPPGTPRGGACGLGKNPVLLLLGVPAYDELVWFKFPVAGGTDNRSGARLTCGSGAGFEVAAAMLDEGG